MDDTRILVVEDDADINEVVCERLGGDGTSRIRKICASVGQERLRSLADAGSGGTRDGRGAGRPRARRQT